MRLRALLSVVVSVVVCSIMSAAASGQVVFKLGEDYLWHGGVTVPPGSVIRMSFKYAPVSNDERHGYLSIPDQGVNEVEVIDLYVSSERVRFVLAMEGLPESMRPSFDLEKNETSEVLEGTMTQGGMEFPARFEMMSEEELAEAAEARRPQTPKPPFEYRTEERTSKVVTTESTHTLAGTLTLPNEEKFGAGPYTTVVFITGSGAQDRDETIFDHKPFAVIADHLARKGIASLRSDDRGVFGSTGDPVNPTTHDFVDDVQAQVSELTLDPRVGKIGLVGHSEGAVIGPMVALGNENVAFVVMMAGTGVPGNEVLVEQTEALLKAAGVTPMRLAEAKELQGGVLDRVRAGEDPELMREELRALIQAQTPMELADDVLEPAVDAAVAQLQIPWMKAFLKLDPREALRMVEQPVLVLNGDMDLQVLHEQNIPEIKKALADNPDVTVRVFTQLNHMFQMCEIGSVAEYANISTTIETEVLDQISDWILERFGPGGPDAD